MLIALFGLLFLLGVMFVGIGLLEKLQTQQQTTQQIKDKTRLFKQAQRHFKSNDIKNVKYDPTIIHDFDYKDYQAAIRNDVVTKNSVGTITIPAVGIKEPILEGVNNQNLAVGVVTVKPNERPGVGNYALAGHNQLNSGQLLFGNLAYVRIGNEILINSKVGRFTYIVTQINHHLSAKHGEIIEDSQGTDIITLYTCNNQTDDGRIFVRGTLKKE